MAIEIRLPPSWLLLNQQCVGGRRWSPASFVWTFVTRIRTLLGTSLTNNKESRPNDCASVHIRRKDGLRIHQHTANCPASTRISAISAFASRKYLSRISQKVSDTPILMRLSRNPCWCRYYLPHYISRHPRNSHKSFAALPRCRPHWLGRGFVS